VTPKLFMVNMGPIFKEEFIGGLGDLSEKLVENGFWHPDLPFPGNKELVKDFQTKFGKYPGTDVAWAYIACQIFEKAAEKAGTIDREKVAQTLHKIRIETIGGPYEYDERGVNKFPCVFLTQVQKKERVIVWPKDLATAKFEFMR